MHQAGEAPIGRVQRRRDILRDVLIGLAPRRWELLSPMPATAVEQAIDGWSKRRNMPGTWRLVNGPPRMSRDGDRIIIRPWPLRWDDIAVTVRAVPEGSVLAVQQSIRPGWAGVYGLLFGCLDLGPLLVLTSPGFTWSGDRPRWPLLLAWLLGSSYVLLRLLALWARRTQQRQFNYWLNESVGPIGLLSED